jgi:hypothetical protein
MVSHLVYSVAGQPTENQAPFVCFPAPASPAARIHQWARSATIT